MVVVVVVHLGALPSPIVGGLVLELEGVDLPLVDIGGAALRPLLGRLDEVVVHLLVLGQAAEAEVEVGVEALDETVIETAISPRQENPGSSESGAFEKKRGKGTKGMTVPPGLIRKDILEI